LNIFTFLNKVFSTL